jgi:hypothetical protein
MFAYNPQTTDRSGEIIASGQIASANTQANMYNQLGQDIGGALASIGGMYGEIEGQKAKGRAFKDVFKVVSPSLGISMEQLEAVSGGKIKSDRDWFQVSEMMGPYMPSLINAQMYNRGLSAKQAAPLAKAQYGAASQVAAGQGRVTAPPSNINFDAIP